MDNRTNSRVPPAWGPEMERTYAFRCYEQDLLLWAAATDIDVPRRGPTAVLRLLGAARALLREMPNGVLVNGRQDRDAAGILQWDNMGHPAMIDGINVILNTLRTRYGALPQEVQLLSMSDLMTFVRHSGEDTDGVLARFEVVLHRAQQVGGINLNEPIKAWMVLTHSRLPRDKWPLLLSPLEGRLPVTAAEYDSFLQYVRRNGHLFDGRSEKTLQQPFFMNDGTDEYPNPAYDPVYYADPWSKHSKKGNLPTFNYPSFGRSYEPPRDDASFSSGWSMESDEVDWEDARHLDANDYSLKNEYAEHL